MTPVTRDDSALQLTADLVGSDKPVFKVANAILEKVSEGIKNCETGHLPPLSDYGHELVDLYV